MGRQARTRRSRRPEAPISKGGHRADPCAIRLKEEPMPKMFCTIPWPARLLAYALIAFVLVRLCGLPSPAAATDDADFPALKTRLVSISLFKNGLGFVAREGEIPNGHGTMRIEDLPAPAHGTFWVYAVKNEATIRDVVASERETVERVQATNVEEMIEANVGQTVDLRLSDKETLRAKILAAAATRLPDPSAPEPRRFPFAPPLPPAEGSSLVLLQTGNGTTAINRNAVQQLSNSNGPLKTTIERKRRGVELRLSATNPTGRGRIAIQYLARGITWAPSCAIDITDPGKARVTP